MNELVVDDRQLDDSPGDLGGHRDDVGADGAIARPRCVHVCAPHRPPEHHRDGGRRERDEHRYETRAARRERHGIGIRGRHGARLRRRHGLGIGRNGTRLQPASHGRTRGPCAATNISDDRMMTYAANTKSAGCHTQRRSPTRTASRRSPVVTTQAVIMSTETGAT